MLLFSNIDHLRSLFTVQFIKMLFLFLSFSYPSLPGLLTGSSASFEQYKATVEQKKKKQNCQLAAVRKLKFLVASAITEVPCVWRAMGSAELVTRRWRKTAVTMEDLTTLTASLTTPTSGFTRRNKPTLMGIFDINTVRKSSHTCFSYGFQSKWLSWSVLSNLKSPWDLRRLWYLKQAPWNLRSYASTGPKMSSPTFSAPKQGCSL